MTASESKSQDGNILVCQCSVRRLFCVFSLLTFLFSSKAVTTIKAAIY